ncbi:MAG: RsmE family RNA methyltransferase [Clostridia bacterium]
MKRFYINKEDILNDKLLTIYSEEFEHMTKVLRMKEGDEFVAFNGDGNNYNAKIIEIRKHELDAEIISKSVNLREPKMALTVFQGLAKGEKLELITQKISELGASSLICFESKFSDVKSNTTKVERLEKVAISASKQCGRSTICSTGEILNIDKMCDRIKCYDYVILFYESEHIVNIENILDGQSKNEDIAIIIGPEGGFAKEEVEKLENAGARVASLGALTLRTETAAIAGTAILMNLLNK